MEGFNEIVKEIMERRNDLKESYVYAYLKETGANIEDLALFEERTETGYKWWVGPKDSMGPLIVTPED